MTSDRRSHRHIATKLLATASAACATLVLAAPAGAVGTDTGAFHADCEFSARLNDDPVVFPGRPGASHSHDFSGSLGINAFSTPASIREAPNNCVRTDSSAPGADRSAYWVPTLYVGDQIVQQTQLGAYYSAGVRDTKAIEPFPAGLMVIAGSAAGGPQEVDAERVWAFLCPGGTAVDGSATSAPTCKTNVMELVMRFPDCWNGRDLDSPNHKSHMAYSRRVGGAAERTCPATHPRLMPKLQMILRYPTTGGPGVRLASGPVNTAHADFVNGWDQARLAALVDNCLVADRYCGGGDRPDGHSSTPSADTHAGTHTGTTSHRASQVASSVRGKKRAARSCRRARRAATAPRSRCQRKRSSRRAASTRSRSTRRR
jgi:hypothetical protein